MSKPVVEPFHDGSTCLVRDIATHLQSWQPQLMGQKSNPIRLAGVEVAPVYRQAGAFAPGLSHNIHAMSYLLRERSAHLWHFVFAPNPRSSSAIRQLRRLRSVPVVQTVASPPKIFEGASQLLFGDAVVVHSEWTRSRIASAAPDVPLLLIRPPLAALRTPSTDEVEQLRSALQIPVGHPVVVYPGDLEFSKGAQLVADTLPRLVVQHPGVIVVFACRRKTSGALAVEAKLASRLPSTSVRFAGELPSLLPLLALADCVLFPVEELFAKVDIPISILEAMALGTPVVVPTRGPLAELHAALRVRAEPQELSAAVAALLSDPTRTETLVRAQLRLVRDEFDAVRVAQRYEQLYERLVPRSD